MAASTSRTTQSMVRPAYRARLGGPRGGAWLLFALLSLLGSERAARAGGFEIPDVGAEPLGRGGTFVAKADSPLALYYNVAGMARQRGTRLQLDVGVIYHDTAFTAAGSYPTVPNTPFGGQPYPTMHDGHNFSPLPFLGVTTDFGFFKNLTFGLGVVVPPSIGAHSYGTKVTKTTNVPGSTTSAYETKLPNGTSAPAPSRYDIAATDLLIIMPTLGVAWQPIKYLSIGAAAQLVYASFDLTNANYTALNVNICPTPDYAGCDSYARLKTSGIAGTGVFSVMVHPTDWLDIGLTYRMETKIHTEGNPAKTSAGAYVATGAAGLTPAPPPALYQNLTDFPVSFDTRLPHEARLGVRGVRRYSDGTERYDIEANFVYENWASVQTDKIHSDDFPLGVGGVLDAAVPHYYKDTFGVRVGGAYNHRLSDLSRFTGRLGFYYDSAATDVKDTHLDFQTADKYGFTAGIGYKFKGFSLNLGYAFIYSPPRDVTNGQLRALSSTNGSVRDETSNDPASQATCSNPQTKTILCGYNNGHYDFSMQMITLGLTFNFSEFKVPNLMRN